MCSELGDAPDVLVPTLPTDPEAYRDENSSSYAPKPRTLKLIGMISGVPPAAPYLAEVRLRPWSREIKHQRPLLGPPPCSLANSS